MKKVCIIGASGKLGKYMVQHCLNKGYEVNTVCREKSAYKLNEFTDKITIFPGLTNDEKVIQQAVKGCTGILTVLVPWGVNDYSSGTANAVLKYSDPSARLAFSCGWHITKDGKDRFSKTFLFLLAVVGFIVKTLRLIDINDQVKACNLIFNSEKKWTVVRGSDLEEGESQGLPVWSEHVGDDILKSNITRRIDFALFMVESLTDDNLIHKAPAIVSKSCKSAINFKVS